MKFRSMPRALLSGLLGAVIALAPTGLGCGVARAATTDPGERFWNLPTEAQSVSYTTLLKSYGVTSGAAGADFLGITNTNYDFSDADPSAYASSQYGDYSYSLLEGTQGAGLGIWGTEVNESPNLFYHNLMYNAGVTGTSYRKASVAATTWAATPDPINNWNDSSWGDSFGVASTDANGANTVNGLEYAPELVFGANKQSNWGDFSYENTNTYQAVSKISSYDPTYVNRDSTNAWTQIYSLTQLANAAENLKAQAAKNGTMLTTRYDDNNALTGALSYEKSIRGNLLYIASQLDKNKAKRKKVAYLYQLDSGTGTFLVPRAEGLLVGADTGDGTVYDEFDGTTYTGYQTRANAKANNAGIAEYASNNAMIDYDCFGVLPFITDTFDKGLDADDAGMRSFDIRMADIWKTNPTVTVGSTDRADSPLADVDVIIFNTDSSKHCQGADVVRSWASIYGFDADDPDHLVIAGSDFGDSSEQGYGVTDPTEEGMSPLLYNQRDFSADELARMAWSFSQVYPELYDGNADASYAYWVDKVYHVKTDSVSDVVRYMTNQSDEVSYDEATATELEGYYRQGLEWWQSSGSTSKQWRSYAYYTGSSRASYYSGKGASEEPARTIGIFQPSQEWIASVAGTGGASSTTAVSIDGYTVTLSPGSFTYTGAARRPAVTVRAADGTTLASGTDYDVAYAHNVNAGTATVTVTGTGAYTGTASARFTIGKAANTLKLKASAKAVKAKKLKKKKRAVKPLTVSGAKGAVSYKRTGGSKKLAVNAKTGKVTVKKGTKKGAYKIKVKVTATGNANYKAASKTVTAKVKVR